MVELNGQTLKPSCFEGNLADHLTNLARPFTLSFTRDNFALCSECDRSSRLTAPAGAAPGDPAWIYWSGLRPQPDDLVTGEVVDLTGQPYEAASSSEDMFQGQEEEGGNDDERWLKIHVPEYTLGYRRCYVPLTDISGVPILEPFEAPFQAGDPIRVPLIPEAEARRLTEVVVALFLCRVLFFIISVIPVSIIVAEAKTLRICKLNKKYFHYLIAPCVMYIGISWFVYLEIRHGCVPGSSGNCHAHVLGSRPCGRGLSRALCRLHKLAFGR